MIEYYKMKFKEIESVYGKDIALNVLILDIIENKEDIVTNDEGYDKINKVYEKWFLSKVSQLSFKEYINKEYDNTNYYTVKELDKCLEIIKYSKNLPNPIIVSNKRIYNIFKIINTTNDSNKITNFTYYEFELMDINLIKKDFNVIFIDHEANIIETENFLKTV